jgi:hypothetical protein
MRRVLARGRRLAAYSMSYAWFYAPSVIAPRVALTAQGEAYLAQLRDRGILTVHASRFCDIAAYIDATYFAAVEGGAHERGGPHVPLNQDGTLFVRDVNKPVYRASGTEISSSISFRDPRLAPLFFDPDLMGALYNYYRRQPYFRNQPLVQKISYDGRADANTNGRWHIDSYRQVSIMLLVSDVALDDTHMQYALGSHRRLKLDPFYTDDALRAAGYPIYDLVGKSGTLFMFDTQGIHRAKYVPNTTRKILHMNFTPGHNMAADRLDRVDDWPALAGYPRHLRRLIGRLAAR